MHHCTTMNDLIRYLFQQSIEKMRQEDKEGLENLFTTLMVLSNAAEHYQDGYLEDLFDHVRYLAAETLMDARVKAEMEIPNIEARIKALD
jgi:hypothetical protein